MPTPPYDLSLMYLNQRRLAERVGADNLARALAFADRGVSAKARANLEIAAGKDLLLAWLQENRAVVRPIADMLISEELLPGSLFMDAGTYRFRGVRTIKQPSPPVGYRTIELPARSLKLNLRLHSEHVAPGSPGDLLTNKVSDLHIVAVAESIEAALVNAVPISIGRITDRTSRNSVMQWVYSPEVHADSIDSFIECSHEPNPRPADLHLLSSIPEACVKSAFAEIIGEPLVPKDWGGERSDLFSTHVRLQGRRASTAFALKGPARKGPMSLAHLGSRGDQIMRLFSEPADLLLLQHHDTVRTEVRNMMRIYAIHHGSRFCIIDGYDTLRILRAYERCGFYRTPR